MPTPGSLVKVASLAALLALASPLLADHIEHRRLSRAAEAVATHLREARAEAMRRAGNVMVTVLPGPAWCVGFAPERLAVGSGPGWSPAPCDCRIHDPLDPAACALDAGSDRLLRAVSGADWPRVTLEGEAPPMIRFNPKRGSATPAAHLDLRSPRGAALRVEVASTGRVHLCTPQGVVGSHPPC